MYGGGSKIKLQRLPSARNGIQSDHEPRAFRLPQYAYYILMRFTVDYS